MHLYDEIKSHFKIPNAFSNWENYRNTLTSYLIAETDQLSLPLSFSSNMTEAEYLPTLAIIGAGACNDLDLEALSTHFSRITLIDYDLDAMKEALASYHLENNPVIELLPVSLNGLDDSDYQQFCEQLQVFVTTCGSSLSRKDFELYALSLLEHFYEKSRKTPVPLLPASYDYIWCFGVHSQLQAMFSYVYRVFEVNLKDTFTNIADSCLNSFTERLKEENHYFIPRFHDAMLASAKKSVFIGCEHRRLGDDTPIEGAYQGIHDLRKRKLSLTEHILLWNFYPAKQISYEMLIQKITL